MLNPALAAAVHSLAPDPQMASAQQSTLSTMHSSGDEKAGNRFNVTVNVVRAVGLLHPKLGDTSL